VIKFDLKLKGAKLPPILEKGLQSIVVSDALDRLDTVEARFYLPAGKLDANAAWHGEKFSIVVKSDAGERKIAGEILEVAIEKVANHGVTLIIRGVDAMHKLKRKRKSKTYEGSHSAVAESVAKESMGAEVQGVSGSARTYMQTNVTDAQFIKSLALANNYAMRVDDGKLRFVRKTSAGENANFQVTWDKVSKYRVAHNLDGIVTKVTVIGYDPLASGNPVIKGEASSSDATKISGGQTGPEIVQSKLGGSVISIDNSNITTTSEAGALAKAEVQRRSEHFVRGSFVTMLAPTARSGGFVTIKDAPWPIGGKFLIEEVIHSFAPGRAPETRIQFLSDGLPKK